MSLLGPSGNKPGYTWDKPCEYLHAHFADDWAKCPSPETVKGYELKGEVHWYCDEAAKESGLIGAPGDADGERK